MKTLQVPTFDKNLQFVKYRTVKVKNNPDTKDYNKVVSLLPGLAVGYCPGLYSITKDKKPIEITRFYDQRQTTAKKLKNFFITIL